MDYFIDYFIPRLKAATPEQDTLVEAVAEGYKICHSVEPGGKRRLQLNPTNRWSQSVALVESASDDRSYATDNASTSREFPQEGEPHNLSASPEDSNKIPFCQVQDEDVKDGPSLSNLLTPIMSYEMLKDIVVVPRGNYANVIGNSIGMANNISRYIAFSPEGYPKIDELRISYHYGESDNRPPNVEQILSIVFVRPHEEQEYINKGKLHNTITPPATQESNYREYYAFHRALRDDFFAHNRKNYQSSMIYQIIERIQLFLKYGSRNFPI